MLPRFSNLAILAIFTQAYKYSAVAILVQTLARVPHGAEHLSLAMASVLVALLSVLVASSKLNFESSRPAGHAKYNPMPDYLLAMKLFGPATVQFVDFVTDGLIVWDLRFLKMEVHCAEAPADPGERCFEDAGGWFTLAAVFLAVPIVINVVWTSFVLWANDDDDSPPDGVPAGFVRSYWMVPLSALQLHGFPLAYWDLEKAWGPDVPPEKKRLNL